MPLDYHQSPTIDYADGFELGVQQKYLWPFIEHAADDPYLCRALVEIEGELDVPRLRAALSTLAARHELLGMRFERRAGLGLPVQAGGGLALRWDEPLVLAGLDADSQKAALAGARGGEAAGLRAQLFNLGPARHALALCLSSMHADRRSLALLAAELRDLYHGESRRADVIAYADVAGWQSELLEAPGAADAHAFWHARTSALMSAAPLPFEQDRRVFTIGKLEQRLELGHAMPDEAARADVIGAAFALLLWRVCGQDPVLGIEHDGRTESELEHTIGPLSKVLPLLVHIDGRMPFSALVEALAAARRDAADWHEYFDPRELAGSAGPDSAYVPYCLVMEGQELPAQHPGAPRFSLGRAEAVIAPFKLHLGVRAEGTGLVLQWAYNSALQHAERIEALARQFATLLGAALAAPASAVARLPLLSAAESQAQLARGAGPAATYDADGACLHELIAAQARRTPNHTAALCDGRALSYVELDRKASQLAHYLRSRGAGPGACVALCCERSLALMVGLLGTLKSGAAFVPIDPAYPRARVAAMLEDSAPVLVLAGRGAAAALPPGDTVLTLDLEDQAIFGAADPGRIGAGSGADPAYVLYTSGSTGRPNGVMVSHAAIVNYLGWAAQAYAAPGCGALVATSISFDLTLTSLFCPLLTGQAAVLLPRDGAFAEIAAMVREGGLSLLKLTPTHLRGLGQFVDADGVLGKLGTLVVGGEALRSDMLAFWRSALPGCRIVNEYGPTEATVGCCVTIVEADDAAPAGAYVPIGRPIANCAMHILDEAGAPLPDGVIGEMYIGGAGLAQGYLGQPELSADKFIEGPAGMRLYRSGDLGRRRPDGVLEFLGRADQQVKIRGLRVEPGDIEAALASHPQVAACVVTAHDSPHFGQRLVAYAVARPCTALPGSAMLRAYLLERLPAQMVPSVFVELPALPVTAAGKTDLRALPDPGAAALERSQAYVAPRTPTEEILVAVMQSVLEVERIGIDDNYFMLGGDSLRSVRLTALAQRRGIEVSVVQLHDNPTVRALAAVAERVAPAPEETAADLPFALISSEDRALMPNDVQDAYPLNLLQQGMIFHREFAAKSAVYHAICSYTIRAPFNLELMRRCVDELIGRHPLLRTSFDLKRFSQPLQLVHAGVSGALLFEDLRGQSAAAQNAAVDDWMEQEKLRGFDIEEFPLIRYKVHLFDEGLFQLSYTFHHEIIDGWSDAFMVTELLTHYLSTINGDPVPVRPPLTKFRDAIVLEHEALANDQSKQFWLRILEGAQLMRLPRIAAPKADKGERAIVKFEVAVPPALSDSVKALARSLAVPVKSVLLAAHMKVMHMMSGQDDVLTYTVSNGRPETRDGYGVIGLFVNSLAFRMNLRGGSWRELVLATLATENALLPYRRFPMAELKRQHGSEPLSETLFFFNHYHVTDVLQRWDNAHLEGLKVYGESTFPYCVNAYLTPFDKHVSLRIEYDALQYADDVMRKMGDYYVAILSAMTSDPDAHYHAHDLQADAQRRLLLEHWSSAGTQVAPCETPLHEQIAAQAARTPHAIAVRYGDSALSYAGLDSRANAVAALLLEHGARAETKVALFFDRSLEMMVGLLAVLKAGACYVPLDPGNPAARLDLLAADLDLRLVLTQQRHGDKVPAGVAPLCLDDETLRLAALPTAPAVRVHGQHPAYLIYTSGSTGKPKGVLVTHANLSASTQARRLYYPQAPANFLLLSSYAFDSSVAAIFWTLSSGGTLVLPPEDQGLDLPGLTEQMRRAGVSHLLCIPSLYAALLEQFGDSRPRTLETVIVAGEVCSKELYLQHAARLPGVAFHNEYGPTEATVWSSVWHDAPLDYKATLPIGRPVAHSRIYLLDPAMQPVPAGVPGELYIGGAGVTRGYLNQPALTAERFVPDPFGPEPGARLYRSGDLASFRSDGQLEFLGRSDQQVKVQGFRIEPGEIESILDQHPGVLGSVVQVREDVPGIKRLVAYLILARDAAPTLPELQAFAKQRLPKYMLPASFVILDHFPLKSTGKVDRSALPRPDSSRDGSAVAYVAPATPTEDVLCAIWREVLGLERVGTAYNFFEVGGESLRALHVVARIRKVFRLQLPVRVLFDQPTVAALATQIDLARWNTADAATANAAGVVEGEF